VKVRGTAQTIAEKYMQLARDAHSTGDTVMAESYNQHAEHYLRILAAAQAYNQQHMAQQQQYRRPFGGEESQESYEEPNEGEAPLEESSVAQPEPASSPGQPELASSEGEFRQPRRFEERPRPQFDRSRNNGADQPRQPRIEDQAEGWDGPQPQFLRRGQTPGGQANNGAERQQQLQRRPGRGPRPRDEQAPETDGAEGSAAAGSEPDTPVVN
jgi:hypothetical protein